MDNKYAVLRYWKNKSKKPTILKNNLSLDEARKLCEETPTKKRGRFGFNSFVGFTHMSNL